MITESRKTKPDFIRARKLAAHSGMTMNALRLILNAPKLNPNQKIFLNKNTINPEITSKD